jgi:hypothetical protein
VRAASQLAEFSERLVHLSLQPLQLAFRGDPLEDLPVPVFHLPDEVLVLSVPLAGELGDPVQRIRGAPDRRDDDHGNRTRSGPRDEACHDPDPVRIPEGGAPEFQHSDALLLELPGVPSEGASRDSCDDAGGAFFSTAFLSGQLPSASPSPAVGKDGRGRKKITPTFGGAGAGV